MSQDTIAPEKEVAAEAINTTAEPGADAASNVTQFPSEAGQAAPKPAKDYGDERALVVPREFLSFGGSGAVFASNILGAWGLDLLLGRHLRLGAPIKAEDHGLAFALRNDVENDPSFKQIIPYTLLQCGDKFLAYTRGKSGAENRLHAKSSIGFGGHVNPPAEDAPETLTFLQHVNDSALRELGEELNFPEGFDIKSAFGVTGFVNDDDTEVGSVHLGIVSRVVISEEIADKITANEDCISNLRWLSIEDLLNTELEDWSGMIVSALIGR